MLAKNKHSQTTFAWWRYTTTANSAVSKFFRLKRVFPTKHFLFSKQLFAALCVAMPHSANFYRRITRLVSFHFHFPLATFFKLEETSKHRTPASSRPKFASESSDRHQREQRTRAHCGNSSPHQPIFLPTNLEAAATAVGNSQAHSSHRLYTLHIDWVGTALRHSTTRGTDRLNLNAKEAHPSTCARAGS